MENPASVLPESSIFLKPSGLPPFSRFDPAEVGPAIQRALAEAETALTALENVASTLEPAALMAALERLEAPLGWTWGLANHLNSVRTTDALRQAIADVQPEVITFFSRFGQSRPLFDALAAIDVASLSAEPALARAVTLAVRAAHHAGVGLDGDARERFNTNQQELARLSLEFSNAVLDATRAFALQLTEPADVAGLPDSARALYAQAARAAGHEGATADAGPWRVGLDFASFGPFMEYAERRDLREALYRAYVGRAGPEGDPNFDNTQRIRDILRLRQEQAELLGFPDYAALSLDAKMAPDVAAVEHLLGGLYTAARPAALREHAELQAFAAANGMQDALVQWDIAYWARRLREDRYAYSDEDLRPYFPLPAVLEGLFAIIAKAFGVFVTPGDRAVETWHSDVQWFDVRDGNGQPIAGFFLDPYSRPEDKRGGAWMNECLTRSRALAPAGQAVQLPVAYLICNQSPPVDGQPSLMTWNEVSTLFHEMGHGLQHMLTSIDVAQVAGIGGVEWDAVELPSQFMENWLRHKPFLRSFARHFQTGEAIPDSLVDRVMEASTYRAGSAFLRQLSFGRLDLALHAGFRPTESRDIWDVQREVMAAHNVLTPLLEDRFLCGFGHLFAGGYAAGYYSYKWAEVLSADAFAAFEEAGLDDDARVAEVGRRFRDTVLGLGGSVEPAEVFRRFRGRDPDVAALLRHNGLAPA